MKRYIYESKVDGRVRFRDFDENGNLCRSGSYPRILMEEKLGRPLRPDEDVHHIDGNVRNNSIDNLEIKKHGVHQKEHSTKWHDKNAYCEVCGKRFMLSGVRLRGLCIDLKRGRPRIISCGKSCSAKYATFGKCALSGEQEQINRDIYAECGLNGEPFPNGNPVPNT